MKTIVKIYQNNLVSDILSASCHGELKSNIESIISKLRKHELPDNQVTVLLNETLGELKLINEGRLPYDQHANIISAKNIIKKLQLQEANPGNNR